MAAVGGTYHARATMFPTKTPNQTRRLEANTRERCFLNRPGRASSEARRSGRVHKHWQRDGLLFGCLSGQRATLATVAAVGGTYHARATMFPTKTPNRTRRLEANTRERGSSTGRGVRPRKPVKNRRDKVRERRGCRARCHGVPGAPHGATCLKKYPPPEKLPQKPVGTTCGASGHPSVVLGVPGAPHGGEQLEKPTPAGKSPSPARFRRVAGRCGGGRAPVRRRLELQGLGPSPPGRS